MNVCDIAKLSDKWNKLTTCVLELKAIDELQFAKLLAETYESLRTFDNKTQVPKEICRLFIYIGEWLYFSSLMEEKELSTDFYNYEAVYCIVSAIKNGFWDGCYEYNLAISKSDEICTISMTADQIKEYLQSVKNKTYKPHAGIRLVGENR